MGFSGIIISICSIIMQLFLLMITSSSLRLGGNETDRQSLLAFKAEIVNDPLGILSSWNESLHFCQWQGIACRRRHQRVTVLDLESSQLNGQLPPHIGNLSFLRILNLQNNNFNNTIPQEVGRLFRLQQLRLGNNSFSGDIPFNISRCSNLQVLHIAGNHLRSKLPIEIESLSKLQVLALSKNNLSGAIPPSFGNLSSLHVLSVEENNLHGDIPNSLGQLKRLTYLSVGQNHLNGTIPPSIYNLSSITLISVLDNKLHGTLPSGLGQTIFPNLEIFYFWGNQFSGPIPTSISNASNLSQFSISFNEFTGKVPSLARLSNLYLLSLTNNHLGNDEEGDLDFISSLVNCTKLTEFDVSGNNFGGVLPESISNLSTELNLLVFGRNQIRGRIPIGIGNLVNLGALASEGNLLTGTIPSSIGKLKRLNILYLNENKLSGTIPSSLGNLTSMTRLILMSNKLEGNIPQSLGECRNLLILVLSQNNLRGQIPKEVIGLASLSQILDLSSNKLTGSIPMEVSNLMHLVYLDVSDNRLSGEIPRSLGSCTSLASLYLSGNSLQGTIPESLSSLRAIENFDLSRNNLSGRIPNYLESFPFLLKLNLSFNDFEGALPMKGVFENTSALSVTGNSRICGGIPSLRLPKCVSKQGLSSKLKIIISVACGVVGLSLSILFVILYRSRKARGVKSTSGSSMGVSLLKLSYRDLLKATDGFSAANLIGAGSFGSVYKGILDQYEGRIVAVKVLNLQSARASKSFIAECEALRTIRHRNIVKLLTACSSIDFQGNDFKALVYDFMMNGSLEEWLHNSAQLGDNPTNLQKNLDLIQRVNIAIDIASALDYLHNHSHMPIIHCDLKPSNILLDGDMTACVGDFGLARFLPEASCPFPVHESSSNAIKGSIGYTAPEYGMGSKVSTYGDMYSYGILLLEMLTGKRPTDNMFKDGMDLQYFVTMALAERVEEICDPLLVQMEESSSSTNPISNRGNQVPNDQRQRVVECLTSIARIGVACSAAMPRDRKDISNVVTELCLARDVLTGTRRPREHL
ncbi:putative receptor-like protein kinase At3g47110 [Pyrus x bretschneideri]|uniref:putative receptor-like protein kinase At3g47110 n=1 Tax=Pyrus x bretschneideri TaxID=225117 RepID=UPI00202F702E|nr:putative receptor-like protein kinase At3g47110 [Pyrus x bretschneideri]